MSRVKAHLNGTVTCELCNGEVSAGSWKSATDIDANRYMRIHRRRCEISSDEDRRVFRETGCWPKPPKRRRRSPQI